MLSAGKQIDCVDRVVRRLNADESGCDFNVVESNKLLDHVHRLHFDQLGALETCARWRAESELQLPALDRRKDLRPEQGQEQHDQGDRHHEIGADDKPPNFQRSSKPIVVLGAQTLEERWLAHLVGLQQPRRQHRDERAGEHVRRHHREADGQGQRHEQLTADTNHEQRGNEHRQHAEHREQSRCDRFPTGIDDGAGLRHPRTEMRVDVLDLDRGFVDQYPDSQREAAERHDVDRLPCQPQRDDR